LNVPDFSELKSQYLRVSLRAIFLKPRAYHQLLDFSLSLNGVGLPIAWRMRPKKTKRENSNCFHRVRLMKDV
jgi:hypothetical protein